MGEEEKESFKMEDIVANNNMLLNTLIDLLIEKEAISEEELMKKLEEQVEECGDGEDCCKDGEDCCKDGEDCCKDGEDKESKEGGCCCSHE